ncbi:MAG: hypothetical protein PHV59_02765 [Victivallales bacterium]|nr:hypothetical protein [Victivallales bacterium]
MTNTKKSFAGAGIGIIIFTLCYRLLPPPVGSAWGLRALWFLSCPLAVCLLGLLIFGTAGLITRKLSVFVAGLSSFIFFGAIIYAACCLVFPDGLRAVYTGVYIREKKAEQTEKTEKRNEAIKKAIEENIQEQKKIPKPVMENEPLKLVIKESPPVEEKPVPEKDPQGKKLAAKKDMQEEKTISEKKIQGKKAVEEINYDNNSPFDYGAEELGGYFPLKGDHTLPDVSIKGILTLADGEAVAALRLKDKKRSFYVREGNVIRFHEENANKKTSEVYLQVRKIKNNEVEIIQQQRPDKIIIIR